MLHRKVSAGRQRGYDNERIPEQSHRLPSPHRLHPETARSAVAAALPGQRTDLRLPPDRDAPQRPACSMPARTCHQDPGPLQNTDRFHQLHPQDSYRIVLNDLCTDNGIQNILLHLQTSGRPDVDDTID